MRGEQGNLRKQISSQKNMRAAETKQKVLTASPELMLLFIFQNLSVECLECL